MSKSYCPNCGNALGNLRVIDGSCCRIVVMK